MKYEYSKSFIRDAKKVPEGVIVDIRALVEHVESVELFSEVNNVKKMKGYSNAYRIRISDYRVGVFVENDTLNIYKSTSSERNLQVFSIENGFKKITFEAVIFCVKKIIYPG